MHRIGLALCLLVPAVTCLSAADRTALYTSPTPIPRETLDRLNLKQAWVAHIPMESKKDGIFGVQFPEADMIRFTRSGPVLTSQILVQTRSGLVVALNRSTGEIMWQARPGRAYQALQPLAVNSRTIVQTNGLDARALDRATGERLWDRQLPAGPVATPIADENQLYLALSEGKLRIYDIPDMDAYHDKLDADRRKEQKEQERKGSGSGSPKPLYTDTARPNPSVGTGSEAIRGLYRIEDRGPKLEPVWDSADYYHVNGTPFLTPTSWVLLGAKGTAVSRSRWEYKETMRFEPGTSFLLAPGTYGNMAYLGAENQKVYALNTDTGDVKWEYGNAAPIGQPPFVSEDDVYVNLERKGVMRLDRITGRPQWKNLAANAERVIAVNPKFVYALDRELRLLVLDRARGTELSRLDNRDFPMPVVNEQTDRLFLAAHDGTLVCLYDADYPRARVMKNALQDDGGKLNPLYRKLRDNANVKEGLNDKPLRTILDYFESEFKVPIIVRAEAFRDSAAMDAFLDQPVTLEKAVNVPLGQIIHMLLQKVKAKYAVRPGYLLIDLEKDAK
jgi:outer membrane protein assembly factor BamB